MLRRAGQLLVVALLGLAVTPTARPAAPAPTLKVGDFPPQKLTWQIKLGDYRGKIVIISFWASWCPPCRKELPVLAAIQKEATRDKLVVFAVDWHDDYDKFQQIARTLQDAGLTSVSDSAGHIGRQYDVNSIPHMVIIGPDGRIAAIHVGCGDSEIPVLAKEINSLLRQSGAPSESQAQAPHPPS